MVALIAPAIHFGCVIEVDDDRERHLSITGKVTYLGEPVKRGMIHFLPVNPAHPSDSGVIADGAIKDVFTRTPGDGVNSGTYRVAIAAIGDDLMESASKRTALGPEPKEVARAANKIEKLIPVRYSNARESGLTVELSPKHETLDFKLVD